MQHDRTMDAMVVRAMLRFLIAFALSVALSVAVSAIDSAPVAAQTTSLSGTVFADTGSMPVVNAEVMFIALRKSARSDDKGNFRISDIPMGTHELLVRRIGFQPYTVLMTFKDAQRVEADIMLAQTVTRLEEVDVTAKDMSIEALKLTDFNARRKIGMGVYITKEFFEKSEGRRLGDIVMSKLPGMRVLGYGSAQVAATSRSARSCPMQVVLNGNMIYNGSGSLFDLNRIQTTDIIGLEFYTVATVPVQFTAPSGRGGARCGTLVLWTRW